MKIKTEQEDASCAGLFRVLSCYAGSWAQTQYTKNNHTDPYILTIIIVKPAPYCQ